MAKSAGFCWGVRRAVDRAVEESARVGGTVHTDGPLIHNPAMIEELHRRGVQVALEPARLKPGSTLVVRAHGISPEHRQRLRQLPIRLVDATCPEVARIQGTIRAHVARGAHILIHGDEGHAEVVGLLGHAQGHGQVVSGPDQVKKLPRLAGPVCLVAQSTQDVDGFAATAAVVRELYPEATILDTICQATKSRQGELAELATRCQAIVVVGSPTSANSMRLAEIAARLRPTVLIQHADELDPADFHGVDTVGLTAGASTPDATLRNVRERLATFGPAPT